jgi:hypothetical protein
MKSLADFKKILKCNPTFEVIYHFRQPITNKETGKIEMIIDETPKLRTVKKVQSNAVCFFAENSVSGESWLQYPKASDCKFPNESTIEIWESLQFDKHDTPEPPQKVLTYKLLSYTPEQSN